MAKATARIAFSALADASRSSSFRGHYPLEEHFMNGLAKQLLVASIVTCCCITGTARAHDGNRRPEGCSLETLKGLYVWHATGFRKTDGDWFPVAIVQYVRLNGDGTLAAEAVSVANRTGDGTMTRAFGTPGVYTLDANCRGTLTFSTGPAYDIFTTDGSQFELIQTNPNNAFAATARKVSR
jgi:hypothetical protein